MQHPLLVAPKKKYKMDNILDLFTEDTSNH